MPISLLQAKTLALASVPVAPVKRVTLSDAVGRFLADGVTAKRAVPAQDVAASDGYALTTLDARGARSEHPVHLRLMSFDSDLKTGHAMPVAAGAAVPFGADAVVRYESAASDGLRVTVFAECAAGQNIRRRGEEWREQELIMAAGHRIDAASVAVLASLGFSDVAVRPLTRVALIACGDDSSSLSMLSALVADLATEVAVREACPDRDDAIAGTLDRCLARADLVVACPANPIMFASVVKRLGGTVGFDAVAMTPGRSAAVAVLRNKPLAVVPGPALATLAAFDALARPMLLKRHGVVEVRKRVTVRLDRAIKKRPGRVMRVPARVEQSGGELLASFRSPVAGTLAGALGADGWLVLPEECGDLESGDAAELELRGQSTFSGLAANHHDEATR